MNIARHLCATLGLLSIFNLNATEGPYPEVFDEFITGWVDYDDGYYAAALRAFARAHALDPEFRPASEAMVASLGHMGMPEIGESILRHPWVSKGSEYSYRPAVAFWGIFHSSDIDGVATAGLEQTVTSTLNNLVDLPVVLTSPSEKTWAERKNLQPCAYNLLIFLFKETGHDDAIARIHLIRNYSVESGKELDLALSTNPTQFAHQQFEINLDPRDIRELWDNQAFHEGLKELFDPDVEIENPAYRVDAETAAPLDTNSDKDPWMYLSKASVSTEFALKNYPFIHKRNLPKNGNSAILSALYISFPEWLAHQLEIEHPLRPWLLAKAHFDNIYSRNWYSKRARELREELIRDHPDHPAIVAIQFWREAWGLNHLNYQEKIPLILPHLEKLKRLPPELFSSPKDIEHLERFDKTIRACLGQPVDEPFVPYIITRAIQDMSQDGAFTIRFSGVTSILLNEEVHTISDHSKFAEEVLIGQMSMITDAEVLFATYKEHVQREDALGPKLKRMKNAVLFRIKMNGSKEVYEEACEWWIQVAVDLIESGASWGEINGLLPSIYHPYGEDYNRPMLQAMDRRLEQRGLLQNDDNASLALSCTRTWKISFLDLSPKSQEVAIQYYRERATKDLESYFRLLGWLNWSNAKQLLRAEALHAQDDYIIYLNTKSNPRKRIELAHNYAQLLVVADEPEVALDVCESVSPDVRAIQEAGSDNDLDILYALRVIRAKALAGVGRLDEADQEINQILLEIDGGYYSYREYYVYNRSNETRKHSLSSTLLELKDVIQQTK